MSIRVTISVPASCQERLMQAFRDGKFADFGVTNIVQAVTRGHRIELVSMVDDPDPIAPGTRGTVKWVNDLSTFRQIDVDWDNGRSLMLTVPPDEFKVIEA